MWESESPLHKQVKIIQASNNHYADTNSGTGCLRVVEVYPTCLLQVKFLMDDLVTFGIPFDLVPVR